MVYRCRGKNLSGVRCFHQASVKIGRVWYCNKHNPEKLTISVKNLAIKKILDNLKKLLHAQNPHVILSQNIQLTYESGKWSFEYRSGKCQETRSQCFEQPEKQ